MNGRAALWAGCGALEIARAGDGAERGGGLIGAVIDPPTRHLVMRLFFERKLMLVQKKTTASGLTLYAISLSPPFTRTWIFPGRVYCV